MYELYILSELFIFLIISSFSQAASNVPYRIFITPSNVTFINQTVTITCVETFTGHKDDKTTLLYRGETGKSMYDKQQITEGCMKLLDGGNYEVVCNDNGNAKYIHFIIKSVQSEDSMQYDCTTDGSTWSTYLTIHAPANLNPPRVNGVALNGSELVAASKGGSFQGVGTRTNPFDLRSPGVHANMSCFAEGGYPQTLFRWFYQPISTGSDINASVIQIDNSFIRTRANNCTGASKSYKRTCSTESAFLVDCKKINSTGLIKLTCRVHGEQYSSSMHIQQVTKEAYFVCPGGQRPMNLTMGETIAIAVGCLLSATFLMWGCINGRRHFKDGYHQTTGIPNDISPGTTLHV